VDHPRNQGKLGMEGEIELCQEANWEERYEMWIRIGRGRNANRSKFERMLGICESFNAY